MPTGTAPGRSVSPRRRDATSFARDLDDRLKSAGARALQPPALADLFRFTFSSGPKERALLNVLHRRLLERTREHACAATPFYTRDTHPPLPEAQPDEAPDLRAWPPTARHEVMARFDEFLARDVTFASASHTSGSTGPSLTVYKSGEELRFLWAYYEQLQRPERASRTSVPLTLFLPNLYHGSGIPLPSIGKVFVSGVTDDTLIADAVKVLERTYDLPGHDSRISIVSGLSFHVKLLTLFLLEQGRDVAALGIRALNVVGEYAPAIGRRFLAEAWDAPVFDRFTLTESVAGATRCFSCGHFHLDPHVVGEVLDVDTDEPLEAGVGELTLTDLHPFVQMQPMLRYRTGDLVRRVAGDCACTLTFDFLGKISNCVRRARDGASEWLIHSATLHDVVSEIPDVRTLDTFPNLRSLHDTTLASPPIFTQRVGEEHGVTTVELVFELRYAPEYFVDRVAQLRATIERALRADDTGLDAGVRDGSVDLRLGFRGPGALADSHTIKV